MLKYTHGGNIMNTSNIINYKPKDFSELLGVPVKTLRLERDEEIAEELQDGNKSDNRTKS